MRDTSAQANPHANARANPYASMQLAPHIHAPLSRHSCALARLRPATKRHTAASVRQSFVATILAPSFIGPTVAPSFFSRAPSFNGLTVASFNGLRVAPPFVAANLVRFFLASAVVLFFVASASGAFIIGTPSSSGGEGDASLGGAAQPLLQNASPAKQGAGKASVAQRSRYRINLKLNFDERTFTGRERVRWVNRDDRAASVLYFHLYANHRGDAGTRTPDTPDSEPSRQTATTTDEPRLEVTEVRAAASGQSLPFALVEEGVVLRVSLREAVAPAASVEVEIAFKGSVPEIGADETSLPAHVMQQVGAALRDAREWRSARDTNFSSRGMMLLGACYPVLAVHENDDWQRKVEASVGDMLFAEAADYEVFVEAPSEVALFTSGEAREAQSTSAPAAAPQNSKSAQPAQTQTGDQTEAAATAGRAFTGENLRNFAIVAGRSLRSSVRPVAGVHVRSVFTAEHETTGRRVLAAAAEAVRVFSARFGQLPFKSVTISEAPLLAGLGSVEFTGLGVIASAFYVDFDAPATRNLPEIVREQRASVEDSLEFAVAHMVAHQWWGASVGNDPERAPVLDEALAHWSALLYYSETHGTARAAQTLDDQLRGVYQLYRTFGGDDMTADRDAREYRNTFQYAAIVSSKGALMFEALRKLMGEERFWTALNRYHEANRFEIAEIDDLEGAFVAEAPVEMRRAVTRTFNRWLSEKHGDEDIAPPNPQLAAALGLSPEQNGAKDRNAFSRLGRFFWRQMTRIR